VGLAFTGNEGLKMIRKGKYDLALLDIMLPDASGWDIYNKVKDMKMKFAFLSAIAVSDDRIRELKKEGLSDYITKPFTKKGLIDRISKVIR